MAQTSQEICPFCLCLLSSVTCVGAGLGHWWAGFLSTPLFAALAVWWSQPGRQHGPACAATGWGWEQTRISPSCLSSPQLCAALTCQWLCVGGVTPAFEPVLAQPGAVPVSAVPFSLSVVRSRVPEAEGEELLVSLWAALHGDAHQGESLALAGGCFWWGFLSPRLLGALLYRPSSTTPFHRDSVIWNLNL